MKTITLTASVCRWTARIVGALLSAFFIIAMVAAVRQMGLLNLLTDPRLKLSEVGQAGGVLLVVGLLAGWRWELLGGILSFVGICVIYPAAETYGKITWFFAVLAAPGVLYITSHLLRRYASRRSKTQPPAGSNA